MTATAPPYQNYHHQDHHQQDYHAYHQQYPSQYHQHQHQRQQDAPPQAQPPHHGAPFVAELEAPHTIAFEMPATPVDARPNLHELPAGTHHLDPRPSHARLSVSPASHPSAHSLHAEPSSIPLPLSRAGTPALTPDGSHTSSVSSPSTPSSADERRDSALQANYPQQAKPATKLLGSKKAKQWLDRAIDDTQDRLTEAVRPYVDNPRLNPKNWTTIAQAASHRYLEGKLYGPAGRFPAGEQVDVGLVGAPPAGRNSVRVGEQEAMFPAVGLAPAAGGR